jgi:hypothetical protein
LVYRLRNFEIALYATAVVRAWGTALETGCRSRQLQNEDRLAQQEGNFEIALDVAVAERA